MNLLVTAGATREPIDEVRFVSNVSSGATGAALADALAVRGHEVALLRGTAAAAAQTVRDVETFTSAADLLERLERRLGTGRWEAVLMTAAVADYRPEQASTGKIPSEAETIELRLVRNPKLLPMLKSLSPRPLKVVGFKFTAGADAAAQRAAVVRQWAAGGVDATVHNDLREIRAAPVHPFNLWRDPAGPPQHLAGVPALAGALDAWLRGGGI